MPKNERQTCRRCGTCCRKGGPAFHREDRPLIDKGTIPARHLVTLRRGEPAHDNVQGGIASLRTDVIKIKGQGQDWTCHYFDPHDDSCRIYEHRPLECRRLACWAPEALAAMYDQDRLTRADLLQSRSKIWDLIADHQQRCDYTRLIPLAQRFHQKQDPADQAELLEVVRFEAHLRHMLVSDHNMDPNLLDFLFGRPLSITLKALGLKADLPNNRLVIVGAPYTPST